jgi:hypothetical protein
MKKMLLLVATVVSTSAFAQITITSANVVDPMQVIEMATDTAPLITHTPAGANQTWDYSSLMESETNSMEFGAPAWFTGGSNFPTASMGSIDQTGTEVFYLKSDQVFDLVGVFGDFVGDGTNTAVNFNPAQRQLTFPSTFGTTFNNLSVAKAKVNDIQGLDSVVVNITTHRFSLIDSWGNLTTPFGTFNSIRQHIKDSVIQEFTAYLFGFPVQNQSETFITHTYSFYTDAANSRYTLVQYNYDPEFNIIEEVQWQKSAPVVSLKEIEPKETFLVFPNPSSDYVTLVSNSTFNGELTVVDMLGKTIYTESLNNTPQKSIQVSTWEPGVYIFKLISNGKTITKKVTVK